MEQPPEPGAAIPGEPETAPSPRRGAELRTFLIADIRGYTSYTEEEGDEAAAALVAEFAALVELVATEFEGVLLEIRGDEALVVFFSARQALRAAVELQSRTSGMARPIGIGLDAGEAIPVGNGYRGTALNVAARLCAQAKGGDIVASEAVIHMAARIDGVAYVEPRSIRLKGLEGAVRAVTVVPETKAARRRGRARGGGSPIRQPRVLLPAVGIAAVAGILVLAVATGALGPGPFGDGASNPTPRPSASPLPADIAITAPAFALLDAAGGTAAASIPARAPGEEAIFADGYFWQLETSPTGILKIDPATGAVAQTIDLPISDPGGFTLDGSTLWIADRGAARVVHVDVVTGTALDDLPITSDPYDLRGVGDVVVADGSVWAARPDPGEIVRLDPTTGRVITSYPMPWGAGVLALDGGTIWALSRGGRIGSIDVASGNRSDIRLRLPADDYFSLAVGGGSVWTAGRRKGTVFRIGPTGQLDRSFETGAGAEIVSFADGTLWVGNQHDGTVSGIDAVTDAVSEVATGHTVVGVVAGAGRVLVGVTPQADPFAGLEGTTLRLAYDGDPLEIFDPPLAGSSEMWAVSDATCAKLVRFKSAPAPEGWELEPELAEAMPTVSDDRKTYTFTIREGFTFYPSGEPITAEAIRGSFERAVLVSDWANGILSLLKGTGEFTDGLAEHIEGIAVDGDRLSFTLQSSAEDFLARLTMPIFCFVPPSIRPVPGGVDATNGFPATGPYYLARKERDFAILKRNPTYAGDRTAGYDNIAMVLNQDVRTSIAQVDAGALDYVLSYGEPALHPTGDLAAAAGPGAAAQRYFNGWGGDVSYLSVAPDAASVIGDAAVRRAIALALDRPRLAAAAGSLPGGRLLSPRTLGYDRIESDLPLDGPDVEGALALMAGRTGDLGLMYHDECDWCVAVADIVRENLAAIGLTVHPEAVADPYAETRDLGIWNAWHETIDPVRYLDGLPSGGFMSVNFPQEDRDLVNDLGFLVGEERVDAAAALAERWAVEQATAIPFAYGVSREYFSTGVGCQVFPPDLLSVDLVALCPK